MSRPTLRQLEYIVAVANERHFGRAAATCFVTQPALSAQIREAENLLDVRIFERDRRRVLVTRAGEAIVERARQILLSVDALVEVAQIEERPFTGTLRLGVIPTVGPYLLPRVLPRLRRKYKGLRLLIREDHTERLAAELDTGGLDLLLLALEADFGDAESLPLFQDDFHVVMPTDHPLARKRRLREADIRGEQILLLEDGH